MAMMGQTVEQGGGHLGTRQAVNRALRNLQVFGDLLDGEDFTLTGTCRHGNDQFRANLDRIVQNFQGINDRWLGLAQRVPTWATMNFWAENTEK